MAPGWPCQDGPLPAHGREAPGAPQTSPGSEEPGAWVLTEESSSPKSQNILLKKKAKIIVLLRGWEGVTNYLALCGSLSFRGWVGP